MDKIQAKIIRRQAQRRKERAELAEALLRDSGKRLRRLEEGIRVALTHDAEECYRLIEQLLNNTKN